jgi:phage shock protein A
MGIFRRCTDILSANLNDLVDRFEDPEKALRQAIREMEAAVTSALNSAAKVIANERLLGKQLCEQRDKAEQWLGRARQAMREQDESLARRALVRKAEHDRLIAALTDEQASLEGASTKLRRQIDGMRARVAEANRKLATLIARKHAADAQRSLAGLATDRTSHAEFARFDRLCQKVDTAEAEAQAWAELNGADAEFEAWPDCLDTQIEAELQTLRSETAAPAI